MNALPNELWAKTAPVAIAVGEAISYSYDFTAVGTPTTVVDEKVYDEAGADKSSMLSGTPDVTGTVVTASKFAPTDAGRYRYRVSVTIDGNTVYGLCDFWCFDPSKAV